MILEFVRRRQNTLLASDHKLTQRQLNAGDVVRLTPCDGTNSSEKWCCGDTTNCCTSEDNKAVVIPGQLGNVSTSPSISPRITSTSLSSSTSSSSLNSSTSSSTQGSSIDIATASSLGSNSSSLSGGEIAGMSGGVAIGVVLLSGLGFLSVKRWQTTRMKNTVKLEACRSFSFHKDKSKVTALHELDTREPHSEMVG